MAESNKGMRVELRRRRVAALLVRGLTQSEIAEALGVGRRTIVRDCEAIRAELQRRLVRASGVGDIAADFLAQTDHRRRELSALIQRNHEQKDPVTGKITRKEDSHVIVKAMREMRTDDLSRIKVLQSLGLVYKVPEPLSPDLRTLLWVESMTTEEREQIESADDDECAVAIAQVRDRAPVAALLKAAGRPSRRDR